MKLTKEEREIKKILKICVPLIFLGMLIPIGAYFSFLMPEGETTALWFQRSGSICVLLGVWAEYNLSKVNEHINPSGVVVEFQMMLSEKYKLFYSIAKYLGVLLAATGTFIWGYGDLLI